MFTDMIVRLHRNMKARVVLNGKLTNGILVDNDKKGDILALTLFSIFFCYDVDSCIQELCKGVLLQIGTTGRIFDLRRFSFKYK